jgi:hypothetical protein
MRLALLALAAIGCAHDVHARFPSEIMGSSVLELRLTAVATGAIVTVNGKLVADGEKTSRIVVEGVPSGPATVMFACDGEPQEKVFTVEMPADGRMIVPIAVASSSVSPSGVAMIFLQAVAGAAAYATYAALKSL